MAHDEPLHEDLRCLHIQLFLFLVLKELTENLNDLHWLLHCLSISDDIFKSVKPMITWDTSMFFRHLFRCMIKSP